MKSAVKKPRRKRAPKFEIVICNCGGSDFKFVLSSDVERLRQRIVCACCAQPVEDESILNTVIELAGGCSR